MASMDRYELCINCPRQHRGPCCDSPRACWACGEVGHIQRFCFQRGRTGSRRSGTLDLGSASWYRGRGLTQDPCLTYKIRSTLKTAPGATIFVNDECVYRGVEAHYFCPRLASSRPLAERISRPPSWPMSPRLTSGRPLAERILRPLAWRISPRRSRSPSRERPFKRSRSPFRLGPERIDPDSVTSSRTLYEEKSEGRGYRLSSPVYIDSSVDSAKENISPQSSSPLISFVELKITPASPAMKPQVTLPHRPVLADRTNFARFDAFVPANDIVDATAMSFAQESSHEVIDEVIISDSHFESGISPGAFEGEYDTLDWTGIA
ncbi:MAG: hypothetical protein M1818_004943 [Claussenomyces sp. TS43310]|nr:MAG: hypothetical protein M1818_004943 [Claussenomyces sp. TS43310]